VEEDAVTGEESAVGLGESIGDAVQAVFEEHETAADGSGKGGQGRLRGGAFWKKGKKSVNLLKKQRNQRQTTKKREDVIEMCFGDFLRCP
jgi:hypothetical protein